METCQSERRGSFSSTVNKGSLARCNSSGKTKETTLKLLATTIVTIATLLVISNAWAMSPRQYAGPCLARIIDLEGSGWNPRQYNTGGSGAYGLPQALPGSKMSVAGRDWRTNPYTQIRWMRMYVVERYGSCWAALNYWYIHRSY